METGKVPALAPGRGAVGRALTEEQILELRKRYAAGGVTQTALAREFGISQPGLSDILRGVRRGNVAPVQYKPQRMPHGSRHWRARLTEEQASQIRKRWKGGEPQSVLAAKYGIGRTTVWKIIHGIAWRTTPRPPKLGPVRRG
jgi:DNA invertase Pin-like site-specific DNA recombinase